MNSPQAQKELDGGCQGRTGPIGHPGTPGLPGLPVKLPVIRSDQGTPLPVMSEQEANWQEHCAGVAASAEARKQGFDPQVQEAFISATAGPVTIGGHTFQPACEGTIATLQRLGRMFRAWAADHGLSPSAPGEQRTTYDLIDLGLSMIAAKDPLATWRALDRGEFPQIVAEAERVIFAMPIETSLAMRAHLDRELDRIDRLYQHALGDPSEKKHLAAPANGRSHATPIQWPAAGSLSLNGSVPNTA